ncbi:unnamed protein product [Rangifer tarandus platyrhynchus]|uniref:DNA repair protein SWI5 homolog n=1 Tax=Rangifer tarandus platyrhynchus TaxID=3082113 RepID=A0ABN8ZLU3_RANTA|nr:unnamed protein product [Rangifer tarandus platyrhynchus]
MGSQSLTRLKRLTYVPGPIVDTGPSAVKKQSPCPHGVHHPVRPSPKPGQADRVSEESLHLDIQKLKEKKDMLDKEITQLLSEGYSVDELEDHISQLHEYNDIKDVAQMLLGRLAVIRGVTTKDLYPEFGLDMND